MLKADVLVLLLVPVLISRLVGLSEHEMCAVVELGEHVKATVPVKPFIAVTVMVELPEAPGAVTVEVSPVTAKSAEGAAASHAVIRLATSREPKPVA